MPGPPPELMARFDGGNTYRYILNSAATYDDFDATLTFRLLWGDLESTVTGLLFRRVGAGFYRAFISTVGTWGLLYVVPQADQPDKRLVPYTAFSAIDKAPGAVNELRVVCVRDRIRVLINGQQAASLRDQSAGHGLITIGATSKVPFAAAYQSLVVREPEREAAPAPAPAPLGAMAQGGYQVLLRAPAPSGSKIQAIKAVREATGLGLKEAKDLVELPQGALLLADTTHERAERVAADLRKLGVDVQVRKA
jgi:large subunit ribosomal protein L7/L12